MAFVPSATGANLSELEFKKYAQTGKMNLSQFKRMCQEKSYDNVSEEEIEAAFVRLNTSCSGTLTYAEYLVWWKTGVFDATERQNGLKFRSAEEKQKITQARGSFLEGTGGCDGMTKEQFLLKCYIAGYCLTDDELDDAFNGIDKDASGHVDFIEYLRWRMQDDRFAHLQFADENAVYVHQIAEFFRMYDSNLKGFLSLQQFTPLYDSLVVAGRIQTPIEEVVKELSVSGEENVVKLNDFVRWYSQGEHETEETEETAGPEETETQQFSPRCVL